MQTLMTWLMALLVVSLASVTVLLVVLGYRTQTRWMRIFSEQQGIPAASMEARAEKQATAVTAKPRKKLLSIPLPGADLMRQMMQSQGK